MTIEINRIFLNLLARECDVNPDEPFDKIFARVQGRVVDGDPTRNLALVDVRTVKDQFFPRLVPNPAFWKETLNRGFSFFLLKASSSNYDELLNELKEVSDLSYYVCYGEIDVVILTACDEKERVQIQDFLTRKGFPPIPLRVEEISYYFGHRPRHIKKGPAIDPTPFDMDELLKKRSDEVDQKAVGRLKEMGVVLGTVVHEDHNLTGRIRALVAIQLAGTPHVRDFEFFEDGLLRINDEERKSMNSSPITSVFRCSGAYSFILQVICDDQPQLDRVTDRIKVLPKAANTVSFIVAKYHFSPLSYSGRRARRPETYALASNLAEKAFGPLIESLRSQLHAETMEVFLSLDSNRQMKVLAIFHDLSMQVTLLNPAIRDLTRRPFILYLEGIINNDLNTLKAAGREQIIDTLEPRHLELARVLDDTYMSSDRANWQGELHIREDSEWQKAGLQKWGETIYPAWNKHSLLGAAFHVEQDILASLSYLGRARNSTLAHPAIDDSGRAARDVDELTHLLREVFRHSYRVLEWLPTATKRAGTPVVPLDLVKRIILADKWGSEMTRLQEMKGMRVDLGELHKAAERERDPRWRELVERVERIQQSEERPTGDTLRLIEELVMPRIVEEKKPKARKILEAIHARSSGLPFGMLAALLATPVSEALRL